MRRCKSKNPLGDQDVPEEVLDSCDQTFITPHSCQVERWLSAAT